MTSGSYEGHLLNFIFFNKSFFYRIFLFSLIAHDFLLPCMYIRIKGISRTVEFTDVEEFASIVVKKLLQGGII